jgi:predicted dinucleotide-binding enzyme
MRIAIIGAGGMGSPTGKLLARAGYEVVFSGSRSPRSWPTPPSLPDRSLAPPTLQGA